MITVESLVDLTRRFVLRQDETIEWMTSFPEGPVLDVETADRAYTVRVVQGLLQVEKEPWLEAVVVASREDQDIDGPTPREIFLVSRAGAVVRLADPDEVARIGERLPAGGLPPLAYAEILVHGQWPGGWSKRVVSDPEAWRDAYPAEAPLPSIGAPHLAVSDGGILTLSFAASRERAEAAGGRTVLDVSEWSVRALANAPATWRWELVAEAVPVKPPWSS
ncbi:hypothetical protein [Plantactinospora sp. GCM10030261]|uniref:hypothetical protein n=1 Tax=Plantactinospora sp. GCM10030261 TaxID=3273420 RepID=UPI0036112DE5